MISIENGNKRVADSSAIEQNFFYVIDRAALQFSTE